MNKKASLALKAMMDEQDKVFEKCRSDYEAEGLHVLINILRGRVEKTLPGAEVILSEIANTFWNLNLCLLRRVHLAAAFALGGGLVRGGLACRCCLQRCLSSNRLTTWKWDRRLFAGRRS